MKTWGEYGYLFSLPLEHDDFIALSVVCESLRPAVFSLDGNIVCAVGAEDLVL